MQTDNATPAPTQTASHGRKWSRAQRVAHRYDIAVSTLWGWVKAGKFPHPYHLSNNCTAWLDDDLDAHDARIIAASRRAA